MTHTPTTKPVSPPNPGPTRPARRVATAVLAAALLLAAPLALADAASQEEVRLQAACEVAIDRGLNYLANSQRADGAWANEGESNVVAYTSLAVMAFLARGYAPGLPPYGDALNRGVDFVLNSQRDNGMVTGQSGDNMYIHTIATLMLAEVSGIIDAERQAKLDAVLPKALKVTLDAQRVQKAEAHQGGWRYSPGSTDSDLSLSGWALMSLRAARANGAGVPEDAVKQAVAFILRCRSKDGGFSYQPGGNSSNLARTGAGLLSLELCGDHRSDATKAAGDYVLQNFQKLAGDEKAYNYALYYCSQGMFQLGEGYWERFAPMLFDLLLKNQKEDGSWTPRGELEQKLGPNYATAMSVLALSVTCRQLPIYQR